jgi:predicted MFS family arabinose efflux permease
VLLVAAIQFVNTLDFMMVMPLGPDFAAALGIPTSHIGVIGGSYTLAAAIAGLIGSTFLDRFDRRLALGAAMTGLVLSTAAGGFAVGYGSLVLARVLAGVFGGPAASLGFAIVTDSVPPERRGKAMGAVMGSFSIASVLGVPAGLELARLFGWRAPFFAVAAFGACVTMASLFVMPPMRGHLIAMAARGVKAGAASFRNLFEGVAALSLTATFLTMLGVFSVVPNLSAYLQFNLGYPREHLGILYLVGGAVSFVTMQATGALVDRFGATRLVVVGTIFHALVLILGFIHPVLSIPVLLLFTAFMLSGGLRMVPMGSLSTRVPRPDQRAGFMSAQSAVQHGGSALGAMFSAAVLASEPSGKLVGMNLVASGALVLALVVPFLAARIEEGVRAKEQARVVG